MNFLDRFDRKHLDSFSLAKGLENRPESSTDKSQIISRISTMYQKAKKAEQDLTDLYKPSGEWKEYIQERSDFYQSLLVNDHEKATHIFSNFWRNPLGAIVKEYARYDQLIENEPSFSERFIKNIIKNYIIWQEMTKSENSDLSVTNVGNPWGLFIQDQLVVPKATRYHSHSKQIKNLMGSGNKPVVAEIGGGYCGMAYYMLRDNPSMTYMDIDLPETLVIGAYYLLSAFPDKKILLYGEYSDIQEQSPADYDAIFLPHFELPLLQENTVDLFYNSFSLSEMPKAVSTEYLKQIERICSRYFLHNNMDRTGVINRGYERIPASDFPIDESVFKNIYTHYDLFHGHDGDYKEYLYLKIQE